MKRFGVVVADRSRGLYYGGFSGRQAAPYTADKAVKINVMGEWAHPDDDTSIIGPCGVWHERYDVRCGIIMVTRGEGGGNATGTEIGPALGLRRENEDRVAHYRSGTIDIFNVDSGRLLLQHQRAADPVLLGHRDAAPDHADHPHDPAGHLHRVHALRSTPATATTSMAGRYIWEGVKAAADPTMFPEQLTGPNALQHLAGQEGLLRRLAPAGTGGTTTAADCTTGFIPAATNMDTVAGVWTGYDSPYQWPPGNVQGQPAGTSKIWAQVARRGRFRLPDPEPRDVPGLSAPRAARASA